VRYSDAEEREAPSNTNFILCALPSLSQLLVAAVKDTSDPGRSVNTPATTMRCEEALHSLSTHILQLVSTCDQQGGEKAVVEFLSVNGWGVVCAAMESYPAQLRVQVRRD
jgi:hypothetical protein